MSDHRELGACPLPFFMPKFRYMRGRKPKPTYLKLLHGSRQPINEDEPKPRQDFPPCPRWLNKEAKIAWKQITPELRRLGLLTILDGHALARYCVTQAQWKKAVQFLDKHGETYPIRGDSGDVKYIAQYPQVSISRNMARLATALGSEFGLTPSSRTRLHSSGGREEDPFEAFLRDRGKNSA